MRAVPVPARAPARPLRSRRLLALAGDERLVDQVRRGNEAAFEVIFERHGSAILAFCRHMLGSPEEAEDAVQHTFAAAFRDLGRSEERQVALKPWLFAIARNRCISVLRARREQPVAEPEQVPTAGLAEQVEQRAELRRLLADVGDLPEDQRAALLLAELGDMSHAEVGSALGCEAARVKALVFRARSGLIARREARDAPCEVIREQLANLRGGALRRTELRLHLRECPGCRAYRDQVRQQRRMLAAALPVAPTLGLKSSVLAAIGLGGGSAGGLATAAGVFGGATVAKVAVVTALAGGGVVAGDAVVSSGGREAAPPSAGAAPASTGAASGAGVDGGGQGGGAADRLGAVRDARQPDTPVSDRAASGVGRFIGSDELKTRPTPRRGERGAGAPGQAEAKRGQRRGHDRKATETTPERGRGPIETPPATTPVKRGPPEQPPNPEPRRSPVAESAPQGNANARSAPPVEPPLGPPPEVPVTEPPKANAKAR